MRIACVSDISIGYGSPQMIFLLRSLARRAGGADQPLLIEPHQPSRPPRHEQFPDVEVVRIETRRPAHHAVRTGRIEYLTRAARLLDERRPDVLVIPHAFCLPVLWELRRRPPLTIYYALEMPSPTGHDAEQERLNRLAAEKADLVLFPGYDRALLHIHRFGYGRLRCAALYNAPPLSAEPVVPPAGRNGRILYAGTLDDVYTGGGLYLDERVQRFAIDLYGPLSGTNPRWKEQLRALAGNVRYLGYLDQASLGRVRGEYAFSIVYWSPVRENQFYACPNKFFESLAAGVPVVSAPHPQTRELIEAHGCGIVLDDWSAEAFVRGLRQAAELAGTERHAQMIARCRAAHESELNWEAQFRKVEPHLDELGVPRAS